MTGSVTFKGAKPFCRYQGTGPDLTGLFLNTRMRKTLDPNHIMHRGMSPKVDY